MRSFSDDSRFTVRSVPEIFEVVTTLVARYRAKGVELDGRKFSREVLVNALFLHFAALDGPAQSAVISDGLGRLTALLERENDAGGDGPAVAESSPPVVPVVVKDVTSPKSRRKHGG